MQNAELSLEVGAKKRARSAAPVFVVGCPRSGTTLLYHMLLSAGNFAIYRAESQVFNVLEPRFGDLGVAGHKRKLLNAWRASSLFAKTGLRAGDIEPRVMERCGNGGDFLRIVMEAMASQQGVARWADSTPEHVLYLDRIKETIPDALAIHIIRDGRDVALSLAKQEWIKPFAWDRSKSLQVAALYWEWIVNRGRECGRTLGNDYIEVSYEDLVRTPRQILARLSEFVDQDLDYDRIERVGVGSVSQPNSSFATEGEGGEFAPVARWKSSLSAQQLLSLEQLIGATLRRLGYEPENADGNARNTSMPMRDLYESYFDFKLWLKKQTPLGRWLVSRDLSWV